MGRKEGVIVDHLDHNPENARRSNLHFATRSFNSHNKVTMSASGFVGVCTRVLKNGTYRYRARISHNRQEIFLGTYPTAILAACTHDNAARHVYGAHAIVYGVGDQEGFFVGSGHDTHGQDYHM